MEKSPLVPNLIPSNSDSNGATIKSVQIANAITHNIAQISSDTIYVDSAALRNLNCGRNPSAPQ